MEQLIVCSEPVVTVIHYSVDTPCNFNSASLLAGTGAVGVVVTVKRSAVRSIEPLAC